jgi:hypothetical protein
LTLIAATLWLPLLISDDSELSPLLCPQPPSQLMWQRAGEHAVLDLDHVPPLIRDGNGRAYGRLDRALTDEVRRALASGRILLERSTDEPPPQAALRLGLHDQTWALHSSGDGRGYAQHGQRAMVLSCDLAALLDRPLASLRSTTVIETAQRHIIAADWQLQHHYERWWLGADPIDPTAPASTRWANNDLATRYSSALTTVRAIGFTDHDEATPARANIVVDGVSVSDLGPHSGGRLIRREEPLAEGGVLRETLLSDLDPALLAPVGQAFANRRLFPLDPSSAEWVDLAELRLEHHDGRWRSPGRDDLDQQHIGDLLHALAQIEGDLQLGSTEAAPIIMCHGPVLHRVASDHPQLVDVLTAEVLLSCYQRQVLPDITATVIDTVSVEPRDAAAEIYQRDQHGHWPSALGTAIDGFLDALLTARVESWSERYDDGQPPFTATSTVTLSAGTTRWRIHLTEDGAVAIDQRGLSGHLDEASRRRLH